MKQLKIIFVVALVVCVVAGIGFGEGSTEDESSYTITDFIEIKENSDIDYQLFWWEEGMPSHEFIKIAPYNPFLEIVEGEKGNYLAVDTTPPKLKKKFLKAAGKLNKGKFSEAHELFLKIKEKYPNFLKVHAYIGDSYFHMTDDAERGLIDIKRTLEIYPYDNEALYFAAELSDRLNFEHEAYEYLVTGLAVDPGSGPLVRLAERFAKIRGYQFFPPRNKGMPFSILQTGKNTVAIGIPEVENRTPWYAFANCHACWTYELDYVEKRTGKRERVLLTSEMMECWSNLALYYKIAKEEGFEQFVEDEYLERMEKAYDEGYLNEFTIFNDFGTRVPMISALRTAGNPKMLEFVRKLVLISPHEQEDKEENSEIEKKDLLSTRQDTQGGLEPGLEVGVVAETFE